MDLVVSGILNFLTEQEAIGKADEVQDFYRYGIEITISSMLNIVLVLLMGALTGHLLESVIYLAVFIAVRVITGGYHADTYFRCNLLMCSTFIATAFLNDKVCGYINIWVIVALVVFEEILFDENVNVKTKEQLNDLINKSINCSFNNISEDQRKEV